MTDSIQKLLVLYIVGHDVPVEVGQVNVDILHATASLTKGAEDKLAAEQKTTGDLYDPTLAILQQRIDLAVETINQSEFSKLMIFTCGNKQHSLQEFARAEVLQREIVKRFGIMYFARGNKMKCLKHVNTSQQFIKEFMKQKNKYENICPNLQEVIICPGFMLGDLQDALPDVDYVPVSEMKRAPSGVFILENHVEPLKMMKQASKTL